MKKIILISSIASLLVLLLAILFSFWANSSYGSETIKNLKKDLDNDSNSQLYSEAKFLNFKYVKDSKKHLFIDSYESIKDDSKELNFKQKEFEIKPDKKGALAKKLNLVEDSSGKDCPYVFNVDKIKKLKELPWYAGFGHWFISNQADALLDFISNFEDQFKSLDKEDHILYVDGSDNKKVGVANFKVNSSEDQIVSKLPCAKFFDLSSGDCSFGLAVYLLLSEQPTKKSGDGAKA